MITDKPRDLKAFFMFYALCLGVQFLGGYFTNLSVDTWYAGLAKSPYTPAGEWFGIVWTVLYLLMAFAAWRVWHVIGILNSSPFYLWGIQLYTGLLWSMLFFGHQDILGGFLLIMVTLGATLATAYHFGRVNRIAGLVLVPQIAWLAFATYLNHYILMHN